MNLDEAMLQLSANSQIIRQMVRDIDIDQARWKPSPNEWSVLEVINHLYDEELEDFREHLDLIVNRPGQTWQRIYPGRWVTSRGYNQRGLEASVDAFLTERRKSLDWLEELTLADWDAPYEAPFAQIRAGDMLAAWVAHDLLHMRQLVELRWAYTVSQLEPYSVEYAGEW